MMSRKLYVDRWSPPAAAAAAAAALAMLGTPLLSQNLSLSDA